MFHEGHSTTELVKQMGQPVVASTDITNNIILALISIQHTLMQCQIAAFLNIQESLYEKSSFSHPFFHRLISIGLGIFDLYGLPDGRIDLKSRLLM